MTEFKKDASSGQVALGDEHIRQIPDRPIADFLAELAELEKTTRPQDGPSTARGKDRKAIAALMLANKLVTAVAGWAIDHQMGLALRGQASAIEVLPELGRHPLLALALAKVDDHRHEIEGAKNAGKLIAPIVVRQALLNLLQTNPGAFPRVIALQTIRAIEALNYNEIDPILQPRKGRRKIGLSELYSQLSALMWVEHYVGRGFKTKEALQRVADAFGARIATLRSWKRRVREELGELRVDNYLEDARVYDQDYEDVYDEELISSGKNYRELLKQKK